MARHPAWRGCTGARCDAQHRDGFRRAAAPGALATERAQHASDGVEAVDALSTQVPEITEAQEMELMLAAASIDTPDEMDAFLRDARSAFHDLQKRHPELCSEATTA